MGRWFDLVAKLALAALVAAAMLVLPGAGGGPSVARAAKCPSAPVSAAKVASLFGKAALDCYGGGRLTFRAFVERRTTEGGTNAASVSPSWLDDFVGSWVLLGSGPGSAATAAFVPPALGHCFGPKGSTCPFTAYAGRWATVSGHFDGPVAQTCRYADPPPGPGFSKHAAVTECRQKFIILAVGPDALPATDTVASQAPAPAGPPTIAFGIAILLGLSAVARRRPSRFR